MREKHTREEIMAIHGEH